MKKVIKNNNAGRIILELQKLLETSAYAKSLKNYSTDTVKIRTILFICGMLFPWIRAIALYPLFSTGDWGRLYWEKIENRDPRKKEHFENKEFKKFILDNKNKFHELTKFFSSRDKEEFINILFIAFPKHFSAVWTEDDYILINELFFSQFSPVLMQNKIKHFFQLQIEGEKELEAEFKAEKLIDNIQLKRRQKNNH